MHHLNINVKNYNLCILSHDLYMGICHTITSHAWFINWFYMHLHIYVDRLTPKTNRNSLIHLSLVHIIKLQNLANIINMLKFDISVVNYSHHIFLCFKHENSCISFIQKVVITCKKNISIESYTSFIATVISQIL